MKSQNLLVAAAITLSMSATTYATPIQIDFIGTITDRYDAKANVLTGGVSIGDVAAGRFVFDDIVADSYGHLSEYDGYYISAAAPAPWISGSITVNGTTYAPSTIPDFTFAPDFEANEDYIRVNTAVGDSIVINDGYSKDFRDGEDRYLAGNGLSINGSDSSGLALASADLSGLAAFANFFKNFAFFDGFSKMTDNGPTTYVRAGGFSGVISSATVTRLDQPSTSVPEPGSIALLVVSLMGISVARRRAR